MEKKYYYGNEISQYGLENGRVDYGTLAKCFDAVLNNDIMQLTYNIGYWDQVSGTVDNTDEIEELEEKRDELEEENESSPSQIIENEINEINEKIEELEREQDDEPEVFQWYIVDDGGARLLQDIDQIVYYNERSMTHNCSTVNTKNQKEKNRCKTNSFSPPYATSNRMENI